MKAAVLQAPEKLEIMNIPIPPCPKDAVLVRIISACVCNGSDPTIFRDRSRKDHPVVFGHEAYGEILEVGCDAEGYCVGERISWWFTMGAFAQYAVVPVKDVAVVKLPKDTPKEIGPIFELVLAASRAVFAEDVVEKKVLIHGLGPSGLIMAQLCRNLGAAEVVGIDLYENRRRLGARFGCRLQPEGEDYAIIIDAYGDDAGADAPNINNILAYGKPQGMLMLYAQPSRGRMLDYRILQNKQLRVKVPTNDIPAIRVMGQRCLEFYREGKLDLQSLVTDVIGMEKIPQALHLVQEKPDEHIKIIIDMERSTE